ncbi:MAG: FecR family protein [Flavobacterium sp.]|nr:MAG: FecR family protein [Flavobacterium sp.]
MKNNKKADDLIKAYTDGNASKEERKLVESWYLNFNSGNTLNQVQLQEEHDLGLKELNNYLNRPKKLLWMRVAAAAVLAIVATSVFFYSSKPKGIKESITLAQDIPPGRNRATVKLANGHVVQLSEKQRKLHINRYSISYADGTIVNNVEKNDNNSNEILVAQTPRGGTYSIILSDGTLVMLNSESSLKFPQSFEGSTRVVELIGEAYFEVAKNKQMPFFVKSPDQSVEVLGTRFNISAYPGTTPKTTLKEGSVKIAAAGTEKLLVPGEEAKLWGKQLQVKKTDVKAALSWKDDYFRFDDESLPDIMLKISRWYDVEIEYQGEIKKEVFTGEISRFSNISDVLDMLERTKTVHFKLEGRRVTVLN